MTALLCQRVHISLYLNGQSRLFKELLSLSARNDAVGVGLHCPELGHVVVELFLGDDPDIVGVLLLVAALPVAALLLRAEKLPVLVVVAVSWPTEGVRPRGLESGGAGPGALTARPGGDRVLLTVSLPLLPPPRHWGPGQGRAGWLDPAWKNKQFFIFLSVCPGLTCLQ